MNSSFKKEVKQNLWGIIYFLVLVGSIPTAYVTDYPIVLIVIQATFLYLIFCLVLAYGKQYGEIKLLEEKVDELKKKTLSRNTNS
jgi:hypothetical protein